MDKLIKYNHHLFSIITLINKGISGLNYSQNTQPFGNVPPYSVLRFAVVYSFSSSLIIINKKTKNNKVKF